MTGKRRSSLDHVQLGFTFDPPTPASAAADLAGFERLIAAKVARALKDDSRSREVIAAEMTDLLGEEVTRFMLDAYASEARDNHNISMARFCALISVTERFDLLDAAVRRIGAALLVGEEIMTARLGHLQTRLREIKTEIRKVEAAATPIMRGARRT